MISGFGVVSGMSRHPDWKREKDVTPLWDSRRRAIAQVLCLFSSGAQNVQYTLLGYEAGYHNTFSAGNFGAIPGMVFSGGGGLSLVPQVAPAIFSANGLVDFSFGANLPGVSSVANGSNPSPPTNQPNFFIAFYNPNGTLGALSGNSGIIALDDGGGGNPADADYDDLVIKFQFTSAVPEASTWAMMVLGFAGMAFLARRREPKTAFRFV